MSSFEFMMVLTSIIIALAIAEVLSGFVRILKGELRAWWVHSTYVLAGFIGIQQLFWDLYGYADRPDWFFVDLLLVFVGPCVLFYLAAALLFPSVQASDEHPVDLEAYYWRISRPFFCTLIPLMPLFAFGSLRVEHDMFRSIDLYRALFMGIYIALALSRNRRLHEVFAIAHLVLLGVFLAIQVVPRGLAG